jgi:hypothetical protein
MIAQEVFQNVLPTSVITNRVLGNIQCYVTRDLGEERINLI